MSDRLDIAVIGSGISGMSAAWLLSRRHQVTLYEREQRLGGHSHTVDVPLAGGGSLPVDMGFIVYNEANYPNLTALFDHLGVATQATSMGFAVSLDGGRVEYGGDNLPALFGQARNLVSPRFWSMLADLVRFYRQAPAHACALEAELTSLGDYLDAQGYGAAFKDDHLLPQAAAIWSARVADIRAYPAAAFIRFCQNHGLLKIVGRPVWRTVVGGSRAYVRRLTAPYAEHARLDAKVIGVRRAGGAVWVTEATGMTRRFDHVVIATHADEGLRLLEDARPEERRLLSPFAYSENRAVLHGDPALMPRRRRTWSAWNYVGARGTDGLCVSYWMNRLQGLPAGAPPLFVTLNPVCEPDPAKVVRSHTYHHPLFNAAAMAAQEELWSLQGLANTWWCGAHFGAGFHEDGLQSGLAVAEALGGVRRPWRVAAESARITLGPSRLPIGEAA